MAGELAGKELSHGWPCLHADSDSPMWPPSSGSVAGLGGRELRRERAREIKRRTVGDAPPPATGQRASAIALAQDLFAQDLFACECVAALLWGSQTQACPQGHRQTERRGAQGMPLARAAARKSLGRRHRITTISTCRSSLASAWCSYFATSPPHSLLHSRAPLWLLRCSPSLGPLWPELESRHRLYRAAEQTLTRFRETPRAHHNQLLCTLSLPFVAFRGLS